MRPKKPNIPYRLLEKWEVLAKLALNETIVDEEGCTYRIKVIKDRWKEPHEWEKKLVVSRIVESNRSKMTIERFLSMEMFVPVHDKPIDKTRLKEMVKEERLNGKSTLAYLALGGTLSFKHELCQVTDYRLDEEKGLMDCVVLKGYDERWETSVIQMADLLNRRHSKKEIKSN